MESSQTTDHERVILPSPITYVYPAKIIDFWTTDFSVPDVLIEEPVERKKIAENSPPNTEGFNAPSSTHYCPSSSTTIQPLYSSCTMSPVDQPLLHTALYRDVHLNQTASDEGLGSSPSSFSSTTPPHQVESSTSSNNFDYSHLNTSSTPESTTSRIEPTTDFWNTPLIQPVNNASEKTPVYTALKPVYPEESYAPSSTQYFPVSSSSSTNQPLYSFCTMPQDYRSSLHTALYTDVDLNQTERNKGLGSSHSSFSSTTPYLPHHQTNANGPINLPYSQCSTSSNPESIASRIESTKDFWNNPLFLPVNKYSSCTMSPVDQPLLHTALYRSIDLNQTAIGEGLGTSPLSFSSTTSPLQHYQTNANGYIIGSCSPSSNLDYFKGSTSSTPESNVFSSYSPECSNCSNRNDIFWYITHYLCRQCLPERQVQVQQACSVQVQQACPVQVQQACPVQVSNKRKRSETTNNICSNCETTVSPEWRWTKKGERICNACQNYQYRNQIPRPKYMKNETIRSRNRKPKEPPRNQKVKSSSRKNAKKSTSKTALSYQHIPKDVQNYTFPSFNTPPVQDFSSSNNIHMLPFPPINIYQTFNNYCKSEMFTDFSTTSDAQKYLLPSYNTFPVQDFLSINNCPILPAVSNNNAISYGPGVYNIYNSLTPNETINVAQGLPSLYTL